MMGEPGWVMASRCTVPRLSSSEPLPSLRPTPSLARPAGAERAASPSTRPLPCAIGSAQGYGCEGFFSAYLMRAGVVVDESDSMSATSPDTTPAYIEVPLPRRYGAAMFDGKSVLTV